MIHRIALLALLLHFAVQPALQAQAPDPDPDAKQKIGLLKRILLDIFYQPPLKKEIKAILKKKQTAERLDGLEDFLKRMESGEPPEKQKMLLETPCSYYTFMGLYWCFINNDSTKAYENFAIAANIRKEQIKLSEKDKHLLEKISAWLKKYGIAGVNINFKAPITGINRWAERYVRENKEALERLLKAMEQRSNRLSKEIEQLSAQQNTKIIERDSLLGLVRNKSITLSGVTLENYQQALKEIRNFLKQNEHIDLSNITEQLPSGATIHIREESPSAPQRPIIELKEYELNKHCDYNIRAGAQEIIRTILELMQFSAQFEVVPDDYKSQVKIVVRIKGNADGNKIARDKFGKSTMKYKGEPIPLTSYFCYNTGDSIRVAFSNNTLVNDEDLGFLRAYCAYLEIEKVLQPFRHEHVQIEYRFESEVHPNKGEAYRGVEIDMQVMNLFTHLLDRIKVLNREIKMLETQINKKNAEYAQLEKEIQKKQRELEEQEKRIKTISDTINRNLNKIK
jgi:hypothetical protein